MEGDNKINVVDLSREAGDLARAESARAGVPFMTPVQVALGSGLDVALTLWGVSGGSFSGLDSESARRCVDYFRDEAERSERIDLQVAIWYRAWATAISRHFC